MRCSERAALHCAARNTSTCPTSNVGAFAAEIIVIEAMNAQRNIDWTVVFAIAARTGPRELVRALRTAMETEFAAFTEKYDAILARQRATFDEILAQERAEFQQHYTALKDELLARIDDELGPVITALRRELAAARTEIDRLRAAQQPAQ